MSITVEQLRFLARAALFPYVNSNIADIAAAVAMAESGGVLTAVGDTGQSFGLWQVHHPSHPEFEPALLLTPWYAAAAAFRISQGGHNWQPWTTFRNGAYQKYMPG